MADEDEAEEGNGSEDGDGREDADSGQDADESGDADEDGDGDADNEDGEDDDAEFALTITDSNGNHVRTLEAPSEAGVNEVVWDWRFDAPYEADGQQGGGGGGGGFGGGGTPQGPIALPGVYTVSVEARGQTYSATVEIQADPRRTMSMADRIARQETLMSLHRLAVPIHEANQAISRLEGQLDDAEELIDGANAPPEGIEEELEAIREALEAVQDDVTEARRNAGVARAIQGSSTLPTEDHLWQVDHAWELMGETVGKLNELIRTRVPDLNAQLYAEGVRPDTGGTVEMPGT